MSPKATRLQNEPGKPIVTREPGWAIFYCVKCHETYQKCQCRVYVSADTLGRGIPDSTAQQKPTTKVVQLRKNGAFHCLSCERPMKDTGKQWECICGFFYKPAVAGSIPAKYK